MKLDSEPVLCHSTLGHKPDSKPFEYKDNALDSVGLKSGNLIMMENQNGLSCDLNGTERNAVRLPYTINDGDDWTEFDSSMSVGQLKSEEKDEIRNFVSPLIRSSPKTESFEKDSDFVMDKSVMECELPELIVCYKESTYHVVKDICIDEGVPARDRILFESGTTEKAVCIFLPPEKDHNKEMVEEKEDIDLSIPDELKFSAEKKFDKHSANEDEPKNLMQTGEDVSDDIANDFSKKMLLPGNNLSPIEMGTDTFHYKSSINNSNIVEQQSVQISGEKAILVSPALVSAMEESNNSNEDSLLASSALVSAVEASKNSNGDQMLTTPTLVSSVEESINCNGDEMVASPALVSSAEESINGNLDAMLASPTLVSAAEESNNSGLVNGLFYDSKMENGSITFDFDPLEAAASGREGCHENGDSKSLETQKTSELEDGISDQTVSRKLQHDQGETSFSAAVSRKLQHDQGETSFSAAGQGETSFSSVGPLSSLINYSGPIAYSGSISLRSDSSTTSTRSFAFPILQSEWNSSPVRMAKADRRRLRKHSGWRQGLLCCRF